MSGLMGMVCIGLVVVLGIWMVIGLIRAFTGAGRGGSYGGGGGYYPGGGGGYYGGGCCTDGGGGSGYIGGVTNASMQSGIQSGNGLVVISW